MDQSIVNKVAESGLITLDLENYYPVGDFVFFDLKDFLFQELILREKDFREQLKNLDWEVYRGKHVAVGCSTDAIIPAWAYMLAGAYLEPIAGYLFAGTIQEMKKHLFLNRIESIDPAPFKDQRVVIKGCGDLGIGESAYLAITGKLRPVVKSLMFGEPCSTVPVYKKSGPSQ